MRYIALAVIACCVTTASVHGVFGFFSAPITGVLLVMCMIGLEGCVKADAAERLHGPSKIITVSSKKMTKPTDIHTKARKARFATKTQILDGALYLEDPKTGTLRRATDEEIHSFLAHYPHRAKELAADVAETYEKFLRI